MLWLFQVFALKAGLYGCQVWATSSDIWFLKNLLTSWKNSRVSRKVLILTACFAKQVRFPFFIGASRFWNSLLSSNNPLLEKIVRADLLLANRSDTWTHQVLHALQDSPASHRLLNAIQSCESVILKQFKLTVREHFIGDWREIDNLTPREAHHSSKVMRTYHTHFGVPLGQVGCKTLQRSIPEAVWEKNLYLAKDEDTRWGHKMRTRTGWGHRPHHQPCLPPVLQIKKRGRHWPGKRPKRPPPTMER